MEMTPLKNIADLKRLGAMRLFDWTWSDDAIWSGWRLEGRFILVQGNPQFEEAGDGDSWYEFDPREQAIDGCYLLERRHPRELAELRGQDIPDDIRQLALETWTASEKQEADLWERIYGDLFKNVTGWQELPGSDVPPEWEDPKIQKWVVIVTGDLSQPTYNFARLEAYR